MLPMVSPNSNQIEPASERIGVERLECCLRDIQTIAFEELPVVDTFRALHVLTWKSWVSIASFTVLLISGYEAGGAGWKQLTASQITASPVAPPNSMSIVSARMISVADPKLEDLVRNTTELLELDEQELEFARVFEIAFPLASAASSFVLSVSPAEPFPAAKIVVGAAYLQRYVGSKKFYLPLVIIREGRTFRVHVPAGEPGDNIVMIARIGGPAQLLGPVLRTDLVQGVSRLVEISIAAGKE